MSYDDLPTSLSEMDAKPWQKAVWNSSKVRDHYTVNCLVDSKGGIGKSWTAVNLYCVFTFENASIYVCTCIFFLSH